MKVRVPAGLAATAVLIVGCGGDGGPTEVENNLSAVEAMAVFSEVLSAVFAVGLSAEPPYPAAPLSAAMDELVINGTAPCDGGGTIAVAGRYTFNIDTQGNGSASYELTETPLNCGVMTTTDVSYRVNGNPNIKMTGSYSYAGATPTGTFNMSFTGGLTWTATGGRGASGSCTVNLSYVFDWSAQRGSVTGSICGHTINQQY